MPFALPARSAWVDPDAREWALLATTAVLGVVGQLASMEAARAASASSRLESFARPWTGRSPPAVRRRWAW